MGPELLIDADDFREEANKHFQRLVIGKRVRLRSGLVIEAESCDKDASGTVICVYTRCVTTAPGEDPEDGVKPKGVIHYVSGSCRARDG